MNMLRIIDELKRLRDEAEKGQRSRERSMVITKIDEAILWAREEALNEANAQPPESRTAGPLGASASGRYA